MIYDTLRKLPKIIQVEIMETGDISLLNTDSKPMSELSEVELNSYIEVWNFLMNDFNTRYNSKDHKKTFDVYKELNFLANKYEIINNSVEALRFDYDERLMDVIREYGYKLTKENYLEDLDRIVRETEGIVHKISNLKKLLPKEPEHKEETKQTDILLSNMAAQTSILGYDYDFYTISVEKFHALQPVVEHKIKSAEKSNAIKTKK